MASWKILSNYKTFGLHSVNCVMAQCKKQMGVGKKAARKMALYIVRTALVKSINDRSFIKHRS